MELTMAVPPLVVPDVPASLADVEAAVVAWGQQAMRQALAEARAAQDSRLPDGACPACGGGMARPAGRKPRKVEARFGPAWLPRRRVRCAGCGRHRQPADPLLAAELGGGRCTPGLRDLAALCGVSWPYRQAAEVLGRLRGALLAHKTIRAVAAAGGATVAEATHADALAARRTPARGREPARPIPRRIEVELDGGWVACAEAAHGLEVKVGVVHAGSEAVGRTRCRLLGRRYAATARGVVAFERLVTAAVEGVNGYAAPEQVLLGDGADWFWRLGADCLPGATPVLDRWHRRDARRRALRAALPDKADRAPWSERLEALVEAGAVPGALAALADLATVAPHAALGRGARRQRRRRKGRGPDRQPPTPGQARHAMGPRGSRRSSLCERRCSTATGTRTSRPPSPRPDYRLIDATMCGWSCTIGTADGCLKNGPAC